MLADKLNAEIINADSMYIYDKLNIGNKSCYKLRDIPDYYFNNNKDKLNEIELKRGTHYFTEMERVKKGLQAWRNNDINTFGKLMNESCLSSINNYESGSNYLIDLFNITKDIDGVLGIRFLGDTWHILKLSICQGLKYSYF